LATTILTITLLSPSSREPRTVTKRADLLCT